jgi:hypothetical protein
VKLPHRHRHLFREPVGDLIPERETGHDRIAEMVAGAAAVITVGDRTTEKILGYGILPDIQIVDGVERRSRRAAPGGAVETITCANPPAHITAEAVSAVISAYGAGRPMRILVSGEEDLLLVPALAHAPAGAILMYGQPGEGMVVVRADERTKEKARRLMALLEG